jgi:hypothetical protein
MKGEEMMYYMNALSASLVATKVTDLTIEPTIREWWLDILRWCYWSVLKGILFIVDILYDIVMYIASLDFLSSTQVGEFYDKYKVLLVIFLTFAMVILGMLIMHGDGSGAQKGRLKTALYGVMFIFLFSTLYPIVNEASRGFNQLIGHSDNALSVKLVQSSTKRLTYQGGKVIEGREITIEEAVSLLEGNDTVNKKSNYRGMQDAYDYDLGWMSLTAVGFVMVAALSMMGHNTFRIVIDIGWMRVLSIIALPMAVVSEGARKKFLLETFKTFVTLPLTLLAFAFFLTASDWLMSLEIFTSTYLIKYRDTGVEGYVSFLFYGISLSALAAVVLDGSERTVGLLGIDTGIKSPAGAIAMMRAGQSLRGGITGVGRGIGKTFRGGRKLGDFANEKGQGLARGGVSAVGFAQGVRKATSDNKDGRQPKHEKQEESKTRRTNNRQQTADNPKLNKVKNIPKRVQNRYDRAGSTGYNTMKSAQRMKDRLRKRGDKR